GGPADDTRRPGGAGARRAAGKENPAIGEEVRRVGEDQVEHSFGERLHQLDAVAAVERVVGAGGVLRAIERIVREALGDVPWLQVPATLRWLGGPSRIRPAEKTSDVRCGKRLRRSLCPRACPFSSRPPWPLARCLRTFSGIARRGRPYPPACTCR